MEKSYCLHVVTPTRTYNIIGYEYNTMEKWKETLQFAIQCYKVKRQAKKWLRETSYSSLRGVEEEGEDQTKKASILKRFSSD